MMPFSANFHVMSEIDSAFSRANVILSDLPDYLPLLEHNINLNKGAFRGEISARTIRWGDDDGIKDLLDTQIDVILVSDCVYYRESVEPLVTTLRKLCDQATKIFLSYEQRESEEKVAVQHMFFRLLEKDFGIVHRFKKNECHPVFASDDIEVLCLMKKEHAEVDAE